MSITKAVTGCLVTILFSGCNENQFAGSQTAPIIKPSVAPTPTSGDINAEVVMVDCGLSNAPTSVPPPRVVQKLKQVVTFQSNCETKISSQSVLEKKQPADILFVLDITSSMQP